MASLARYGRLWLAFARNNLVRELTFRTNFLVKITVELLWFTILLVFYNVVFSKTDHVAQWRYDQYLFFVGCFFAISGFLETFFLANCNQFADLVRTGDLDFYLLKPIDEQFMITCRTIDWSAAPNVLLGFSVMGFALWKGDHPIDFWLAAIFAIVFACGIALAYGFLLMLTSISVWFMRNQTLYEMWWLFTTLMRYPRGIFRGWASPMGWFFSFVVPIMLVINVPAELMVKVLDPRLLAYLIAASFVVLWASRRFFRYALQKYRSASS